MSNFFSCMSAPTLNTSSLFGWYDRSSKGATLSFAGHPPQRLISSSSRITLHLARVLGQFHSAFVAWSSLHLSCSSFCCRLLMIVIYCQYWIWLWRFLWCGTKSVCSDGRRFVAWCNSCVVLFVMRLALSTKHFVTITSDQIIYHEC